MIALSGVALGHIMIMCGALPLPVNGALGPESRLRVQEGLILNVCSVAGLGPIPAMPVYCASKFALRGYTLSAYENFRKQNIKVVLIHPGKCWGPFT